MKNILWGLLIAFFIFTIIRRRFYMFNNKNAKNVSADEAYQLINEHSDLIILDVRTKGEFEAGHIAKAKNIPVQQLPSRINELEKFKNKPILVHCASGGRSPSAVRELVNSGFDQVYHLNRGLISWRYPLKK